MCPLLDGATLKIRKETLHYEVLVVLVCGALNLLSGPFKRGDIMKGGMLKFINFRVLEEIQGFSRLWEKGYAR